MPDRRTVLLAAAGLLMHGAPAGAAETPGRLLERIEAYLNSIDTLKARFLQINPNGSETTGTLWIDRPGRMRLDYDPPSKILLVATDWRLIFYDGSIRQVNTIPISQTPLGILLDRNVDLEGGPVEVTRLVREGNEVALSVIRKREPDQGLVTLVMEDDPLSLQRWAVTDAQGLTTQVILQDIETGMPLKRSLFRWRDPRIFGYPDD